MFLLCFPHKPHETLSFTNLYTRIQTEHTQISQHGQKRINTQNKPCNGTLPPCDVQHRKHSYGTNSRTVSVTGLTYVTTRPFFTTRISILRTRPSSLGNTRCTIPIGHSFLGELWCFKSMTSPSARLFQGFIHFRLDCNNCRYWECQFFQNWLAKIWTYFQ